MGECDARGRRASPRGWLQRGTRGTRGTRGSHPRHAPRKCGRRAPPPRGARYALPLAGRLSLALAYLAICASTRVIAQAEPLRGAAMSSVPEESATLVVFADEALMPLARELGQTLQRRRGWSVRLGSPLSDPLGVGRAELVMSRTPEGVELMTGREGGGVAVMVIAVVVEGAAVDAFSLGLAVERLRQQAASPLPIAEASKRGEYVYLHYRRPVRERIMRAQPTIYLKMLAGFSFGRNHWLVGPGAGFGFCIASHCLVIEADLPALPELVRHASGTFRYRAVSTALRLQLRPIVRERWSLGVVVGALSRLGNATWVEADTRQRTTNFGLRASVEVALRMWGPFEAVLEAGLDVLKDRARMLAAGQWVLLEDPVTPWMTLSLRMRPFQ